MKRIIVKNSVNDEISSQLVCFYNSFKELSKKEKVEFDLSEIKFFHPFLILPIFSYIKHTKSVYTLNNKSNTNLYLETINFPTGVSSLTEFEHVIQLTKSYIPISVLKKEKQIERSHLESCLQDMIYKIIGEVPHTKDAVLYPIMELVGNIFHHSKEDEGYIFGQFYPNKNFLDICIVDNGRGLAKTYDDELNLKLTDIEAIKNVISGLSTKKEKERGYGVWTSKDVVCKAMNGTFVIVSGSSAFIAKENKQNFLELPNFYWQGVVIVYRIPKPVGPVNIYSYIGS